jgi:ferredoxin
MKITRTKLFSLVDEMVRSLTVLAPTKDGSVTNIHPIQSSAELDFAAIRPQTPAKDAFFPQAEQIWKYRDGKIVSIDSSTEAVLFGTRPCDARGMEILDNFFLSRDRKDGGKQIYQDPYWKSRRDKTTIISIACETPLATCACSSLGIYPASEKGSDILLVPNGEYFEVIEATEKGKKFVEKFKAYFEDGGDALTAQKTVKEKCEKMMTFSLDTSNAGKLMKLYGSDIWKTVSMGCISCGACTFFCPTCHCFEMRDDVVGKDECTKCKCWDSCHFNVYSLEASGHNPRPTIADRYKNKILDKYEYHMTLYGEIACTGCGRCSDYCPAGISLAETLKSLGGAL